VSPRLASEKAAGIGPLNSTRRLLGSVVLALALALAAPAEAQATESPRPKYTLFALLEPQEHRLQGHVAIDFVNTTTVPVRELVLHLYPNAFASDETVFAREGGFELRGLSLKRRGSIRLRELTAAPDVDLLAHAERELVPGDQTQLRVRLENPVPAGGHLQVRARFEVLLPSLVARMGQAQDGRGHDFNMIAQWFPKLAKLMPDGSWRSTPYHGAGEFDADFADYELTVHVPRDYVVAAPGVREATSARPSPLLQLPARWQGMRSEHYTLARALDIAFAAAPELQRVEQRREGSTITVEAFAPRGARRLAERQAELAARALDELGALLGPYPHARLVIVIPPPHAAGAAGMEYPGLIVGWTTSAWATLLPAASAHDVVTAHEIAHQWFPMIVASNEVANPVLDEGLAEWLGLHLLRDRYGRASERSVLGVQSSRILGLPIDAFDITWASFATRHDVPSSWRPAWEVALDDLAHAMYLRPALAFEALAEQHGRARLLRALARYANEHRFAHVKPSDLENALDAEYGPGFADRVFVPALAGQPSALTERSSDTQHADEARAVPGRLLALAQLLLGWIGP
jgi:hypothetical protein